MEISVSKRISEYHKENPTTNEIVVSAQRKKGIKKIQVDEDKFDKLLEEYVDKVENFGDYDIELEEKLLSMGINKSVFSNMKKQMEYQNTGEYSISEEDAPFTSFINFPWRDWKEGLLTYLEEK